MNEFHPKEHNDWANQLVQQFPGLKKTTRKRIPAANETKEEKEAAPTTETVILVDWPDFPFRRESPIKTCELTQSDVEDFRRSMPNVDIRNPPWHLIEWFQRGEEESAGERLWDLSVLNFRWLVRTTHFRKRSREYDRLSNPVPRHAGILEFVGLVAYRFNLLEQAVRRDVFSPGKGKTRFQRLMLKWSAGRKSLRILREESLSDIRSVDANASLNEDIHRCAGDLLFEYEVQVDSLTEVDEWVRTGREPRSGSGRETFGISPERMEYCVSWFEVHANQITEKPESTAGRHECTCATMTPVEKPKSHLPPLKGDSASLTSVKLVTITKIAKAVGLCESAVRAHSKKWGKPITKNKGRGGGAAWSFEEIWQFLVEEHGDDSHRMKGLEKLKTELPVTNL